MKIRKSEAHSNLVIEHFSRGSSIDVYPDRIFYTQEKEAAFTPAQARELAKALLLAADLADKTLEVSL